MLEAGSEETAQVELVDVAPTLLALAGLPPQASFAGHSLLGGRRPRAAFSQPPEYGSAAANARAERLLFLRSVAGGPLRSPEAGGVLAVRASGWKYIQRADGAELHDLRRDPREREDLSGERPDVVRDLRLLVSQWLRDPPSAPRNGTEPDAELEETLRALGHLGEP